MLDNLYIKKRSGDLKMKMFNPSSETEKKHQETIIEAFYVPKPKTILVADKPPLMGGTLKEVPLDEFCINENIKRWTDNPCVQAGLVDKIWGSGVPRIATYVEGRMISPIRLAICDMGEGLGKGVFLPPDSKPIQAGDIVCPSYGGLLVDQTSFLTKSFTEQANLINIEYSAADQRLGEIIPKLPELKVKAIDARRYRGIASYMQDALSEFELQNHYTVDEDIKPYIFTANVTQQVAMYYDMPIVFFVAIKNINPGEPIVYPYGTEYGIKLMSTGKAHSVINSAGEVIGAIEGDRIKRIKYVHESSLKNPVPKNPPLLETLFLVSKAPNADYRMTFIKNMSFYLRQQLELFNPLSEEYQSASVFYFILMKEKDIKKCWDTMDALDSKLLNVLSQDKSKQHLYGFRMRVCVYISMYRDKNTDSNRSLFPSQWLQELDQSDLQDILLNPEYNYKIIFRRKLVDRIQEELGIHGTESKFGTLLQTLQEDFNTKNSADGCFQCISLHFERWRKSEGKDVQSKYIGIRKDVIALMNQYNKAQSFAKLNPEYLEALTQGDKEYVAAIKVGISLR